MRMKNNKGITLIALVITIIVMLILVGVTVNVALNGGLFTTTKQAAKETQIEADRETLLPAVLAAIGTDGNVNKNNIKLPDGWSESEGIYTSPNGNQFTVSDNGEIKYIGESSKPGGNIPPTYKEQVPGLAEGVTVLPYEELGEDIKQGVDEGKIQTVLKETINEEETIAVVPTGFEISTVEGENSISGGLVIRDGVNEFVFIPVASTYTEDNLGPLTAKDGIMSNCYFDSQEQLDYYYGEGFFNYAEDFDYEQDKTNIETSINKYKGFYVGRYETTIDENGKIGSKRDTTVLTANTIIKEGINPNKYTGDGYYYRWYGLYKVQKDLYANHGSTFSTMITSKEWDVILKFAEYENAKRPTNTYTTQPDLSGSAYKGIKPVTYDVSNNIFDLAGNTMEWTMKIEENYKQNRIIRGGAKYYGNGSASDLSPAGYGQPADKFDYYRKQNGTIYKIAI